VPQKPVAFSRETAERILAAVDEVEAAPAGGGARRGRGRPRASQQHWVRITSTTPTSGRYPGKWLLHDAALDAYTDKDDIWVVDANGGVPALSTRYLARPTTYENGRQVYAINWPDADASTRGVVSASAQTFGGLKTFQDAVLVNGTVALSSLRAQLTLQDGGGGFAETVVSAWDSGDVNNKANLEIRRGTANGATQPRVTAKGTTVDHQPFFAVYHGPSSTYKNGAWGTLQDGSTVSGGLITAIGATAYSDEQAQDAAASLFTTGTHSGISFSYDDAGNKINATVTAGGGGDNISVNGAAATDADFDDATPAAPADAINARWQKDASTPNNVSANIPIATQAQMEGASVNTVAVTPGRLQNHPGVAKAFAVLNQSGTQAYSLSYNFDSPPTDDGVGLTTSTLTTDFSSANYAVCFGPNNEGGAGDATTLKSAGQLAGSLQVRCSDDSDTANQDSSRISLACFGDQ